MNFPSWVYNQKYKSKTKTLMNPHEASAQELLWRWIDGNEEVPDRVVKAAAQCALSTHYIANSGETDAFLIAV